MLRFLSLLLLLIAIAGCGPTLTSEQQALRNQMRQALEAHSYEDAAGMGQQIVAFLPKENDAWDDLMQAQLGLKDTAAASQTLQQWKRAITEETPRRLELAGDLALAEQDSARALESWNKSLAAKPTRLRVLRKIAQLHHDAKQWAEEDEILSRLIEVDDRASARVQRALARRRLHRWPDAVEDIRRAQELQPAAAKTREAADLFERIDKFLPAIQDLSGRLAITPADDQLLTDRALLFLRSGDPEMALVDSEAAYKLATWAVRPRLFAGLALVQLDRKEEARALGVNPQIKLDGLTPEFLETISRLDAEMSLERTNAELFVTRAWQLNDIGQPALALQDAENAVRFDVDSAGAHAEMAYALAKLDRNDEAFAQIQRATEIDANFSTAWHYRGELEMSRGNLENAIESLSRALAINQTPAALQKREECYVKLGQLDKAKADRAALEALRSAGTTQ